MTKNILKNKNKSSLFKGLTKKEFIKKIPTFFFAEFHKPLKMENITNKLFDCMFLEYGKYNKEMIKEDYYTFPNAKWSIQIVNKKRKFKIKLNKEMMKYLIQIL